MVVPRADQATHEIIPDVSQDEEDGDYCRTISEQVFSCLPPHCCRAAVCGASLAAHQNTYDGMNRSRTKCLTLSGTVLQDKMTLVHWWYYPDSYREWKPQGEIEGKPEPPMPTPVLWKVQVRLVRLWRGSSMILMLAVVELARL